MIELFKKQSTLMKVLIVAVVVVIIGFIVQQIYNRFIKNAIIRETYENIKIIVESTCPEGYFVDLGVTVADKCQPCFYPKAVGGNSNASQNVCSECDKNTGKLAITKVDQSGAILGLRCEKCTNSIPDPSSIIGTTPQSCVPVRLIDTTTLTGNNVSYGLIAEGNQNPNTRNYALVLGSGLGDQQNTYTKGQITNDQWLSGEFTIRGIRTTTVDVFGINYVTNSAELGNYINNYDTNNINNFIEYLFDENNNGNAVRRLLSKVLLGDNFSNTSTTASNFVPTNVLNTVRFNVALRPGSNPVAGVKNVFTLSEVKTIPTAYYISKLIFDTAWSANFTVDNGPCLTQANNGGIPPNSTATCEAKTYDLYGTATYKTVSYPYEGITVNNVHSSDVFATLLPYDTSNSGIRKICIPCSTTNIDCKLLNNENPIVRRIGPVAVSVGTGAVKEYNYKFVEVYTYNILSGPQGNGKACNALGTLVNTPINYRQGGYFSINPLNNTRYDLVPTPSEISVNNDNNTVVITRDIVVKPGTQIKWSNNYRPIGLLQTDPNFGKNIVYKEVQTPAVSQSNSQANLFNNYYTSSISIIPILTISTDNVGESFGNNVRQTIIDAQRNIYEPLNNDPNGDLFKSVKALLISLGLFTTDAAIQNMFFSASDGSGVKGSIDAGTALNPITARPTLITSSNSIKFNNNITSTNKTISIIGVGGSKTTPVTLVATPLTSNNQSGYLYRATTNSSRLNNQQASGTQFLDVTNSVQRTWSSVAVDKVTGQTQVATDTTGIFRSYNSGNTWFRTHNSSNLTLTTQLQQINNINSTAFSETFFTSLCMSDDGSVQYAVTNPGYIYYSIDSGLTWRKYTSTTPANGRDKNFFLSNASKWVSIACSSDGSKVTAVTSGDNDEGYIFVGTATLGLLSQVVCPYPTPGVAATISLPTRQSISLSFERPQGNLSTLAPFTTGAAPTLSSLQISDNNTFYTNSTSRRWKSVSLSSNGLRQTAVVSNSILAISEDSGVSWRISDINVSVDPLGIQTPDNPTRNWTDVRVSKSTNDGKFQVAIESTPTSTGNLVVDVNGAAIPSTGIYYTNNFGKNWIAVNETSIPSGTELISVDIDGNNVAYVSTNTGFVYKFSIPVF